MPYLEVVKWYSCTSKDCGLRNAAVPPCYGNFPLGSQYTGPLPILCPVGPKCIAVWKRFHLRTHDEILDEVMQMIRLETGITQVHAKVLRRVLRECIWPSPLKPKPDPIDNLPPREDGLPF